MANQIVAMPATTLPGDTPGITPLLIALAVSKGLSLVVLALGERKVVGFCRPEDVERYVLLTEADLCLLRSVPEEVVAPWEVPLV
ncbi:hypothetical protein HY523_00235 [Candidatus Berkelbacteria bacterium]|nr:hypothetical protein [Candidatus Berkelbacteria bacterium]